MSPTLHEPTLHEPTLHEPTLHEPTLHEPTLHEPDAARARRHALSRWLGRGRSLGREFTAWQRRARRHRV